MEIYSCQLCSRFVQIIHTVMVLSFQTDTDRSGQTQQTQIRHLWSGFYGNLSHRTTKPTKRPLRPAKTQISLGICPVWSESSPSTWRNIGPLTTYWVHSQDSDHTGQMPRLIWVFRWAHMSFCWFCHAAAHFICIFWTHHWTHYSLVKPHYSNFKMIPAIFGGGYRIL